MNISSRMFSFCSCQTHRGKFSPQAPRTVRPAAPEPSFPSKGQWGGISRLPRPQNPWCRSPSFHAATSQLDGSKRTVSAECTFAANRPNALCPTTGVQRGWIEVTKRAPPSATVTVNATGFDTSIQHRQEHEAPPTSDTLSKPQQPDTEPLLYMHRRESAGQKHRNITSHTSMKKKIYSAPRPSLRPPPQPTTPPPPARPPPFAPIRCPCRRPWRGKPSWGSQTGTW